MASTLLSPTLEVISIGMLVPVAGVLIEPEGSRSSGWIVALVQQAAAEPVGKFPTGCWT